MTETHNPTEPRIPLEKAAEALWQEIKRSFTSTGRWADYPELPAIYKEWVEEVLGATGFYKLLEYVNAAAAVDSYFLNGNPEYIDHNELVTRLRFAHKDLWDVPGVILDPYCDAEMWKEIFDGKGE
jgi:hypothetical protein